MEKKHMGLFGVALALGLASVAVAQEAELTVTEIVVGERGEDGLVTSAPTFSRAGDMIFCQVRLQNPSREAGSIRIAFERAGEGEPPERAAAGTQLEIPARPRYRTFARIGAANKPAGTWRCVARTEEGRVLSHADFTVTE